MSTFVQIIAVTAAVGLLGLVGAVLLLTGRTWRPPALRYFFSFATGTLLGASLLTLLPEAIEAGREPRRALTMVAVGIVFFLVLERFVHPRHPEEGEPTLAGAPYLVVIGDTVHNVLDGAVIGIAVLTDWRVGLTTSLAVLLHEIPQEIADFSVLLYAGWRRSLVLLVNGVTALAGVLGGMLAYWLGALATGILPDAVALVAGGFLYIALSHLLPEVRKELSLRAIAQLALLLAGIAAIWLLDQVGHAG